MQDFPLMEVINSRADLFQLDRGVLFWKALLFADLVEQGPFLHVLQDNVEVLWWAEKSIEFHDVGVVKEWLQF